MLPTKAIARAGDVSMTIVPARLTQGFALLSLTLASGCLPSDFHDLQASEQGESADACMSMVDGNVAGEGCGPSRPRDAQVCEHCSDAEPGDAQGCTTCRDAQVCTTCGDAGSVEPPGHDAAPPEPQCPADAECQPLETTACLNNDSCGQRVCTQACTWGPCEPKMPDGCLRIGPGHEDEGSNYRCCGDKGHWQFCLPSCTWAVDCVACSEGAPSFCDCH